MSEIDEAERLITPHKRGAPAERERGIERYIDELKGFRHFLFNLQRPAGVFDFDAFRPICQNLINHGIMQPAQIEAFK